MKNSLILFLFSLLIISCKPSVTEADLAKINGYWEIQKVELPDGEKKEYKVNETIDFFSVKDQNGFRQKVMPQLNGTYLTNDIKEIVKVTNQEDTYFINYVTKYGKWKEEIIEIQDSVLILKNKDNLEYHYKRHVPFSIK